MYTLSSSPSLTFFVFRSFVRFSAFALFYYYSFPNPKKKLIERVSSSVLSQFFDRTTGEQSLFFSFCMRILATILCIYVQFFLFILLPTIILFLCCCYFFWFILFFVLFHAHLIPCCVAFRTPSPFFCCCCCCHHILHFCTHTHLYSFFSFFLYLYLFFSRLFYIYVNRDTINMMLCEEKKNKAEIHTYTRIRRVMEEKDEAKKRQHKNI